MPITVTRIDATYFPYIILLRADDGHAWNGTAFEVYNEAHWSDYAMTGEEFLIAIAAIQAIAPANARGTGYIARTFRRPSEVSTPLPSNQLINTTHATYSATSSGPRSITLNQRDVVVR